MKRILIIILFFPFCIYSQLYAENEEYAYTIISREGCDSCAIGLPVVTSTNQSVSLSWQSRTLVQQGEMITKLTYYGYNPGTALTRHFEVWIGWIYDFFNNNHEPANDEFTKVFDGECTIRQGGTADEPIALLEIPLDVPYYAGNRSYQSCIKVVSTGEAAHDVFFQHGKDMYMGKYTTASGEQIITNNAAIEYTIKTRVIHHKGIVKDQSGAPVPDALVRIGSSIMGKYESQSDEQGNFDVHVSRPGSYYDCTVTAPHHTSYYETSINLTEDKEVSYELFNKLSYKAGKRYTIILPVVPDSSFGRYYSLDRIEQKKVIFERELHPKANIPYIFIPDSDLEIDIRDMDLSLEPGRAEVEKMSFYGSYAEAYYFEFTNASFWRGENPFHDGKVMYASRLPMQGVLYWESSDYPCDIGISLHDSEDIIHSHSFSSKNNDFPNASWFDLSGRQLSSPPTRKGIYIHEGRKVSIK